MKFLFICTHNRCRSILCEAITNHLAEGRIKAYSAGSQPASKVHPLTLKYLSEKGIANNGLKSQSWDDFEAIDPDVVITVCDNAANEACPVWFGNSLKIHWGLPDPSKLHGTEADIRNAFFSVISTIETQIEKVLALNLEDLNAAELQQAFSTITKEN